MLRRILLAAVMVAATTTMASPVANAGQGKSGQCPASSGGNVGVKVSAADSPATVSVVDLGTSSPVSVIVTVAGSHFQIEPADPSASLTAASWCAKSSTATGTGTTLTGHSPSTNKRNIARDISYVIVYGATSGPALRTCFDGTGVGDLNYGGPIHTIDNAERTFSSDGTCTGGSLGAITVASLLAGGCSALGEVDEVQAVVYYPSAPTDWVICSSL